MLLCMQRNAVLENTRGGRTKNSGVGDAPIRKEYSGEQQACMVLGADGSPGGRGLHDLRRENGKGHFVWQNKARVKNDVHKR